MALRGGGKIPQFRLKRKVLPVQEAIWEQDEEEEDEDQEDPEAAPASGPSSAKRPRQSSVPAPAALESPCALFRRLRTEGETLAEAGRFWKAVHSWNRALEAVAPDLIKEGGAVSLGEEEGWLEGNTGSASAAATSSRGHPVRDHELAEVLEMKAQALTQVHEWEPAISVLHQAVKLRPLWWVTHQSLGRARLGFGQVREARLDLCRAAHLRPWDRDLAGEDLPWCLQLYRHVQAEEEARRAFASASRISGRGEE